MEKVLISNIQRFSTKDGPGIRTTVFFKGCPLKCKWCHNPETHFPGREIMYNAENCTLCQRCVASCPNGALSLKNKTIVTDRSLCDSCGICTEECYYNARDISGIEMTFEQIADSIEKDTAFYSQSGGGVTFSGGECLMFAGILTKLLKFCKEKRIHTAVDTSGFAPQDVVSRIIPYTDLFLYDIKAYDSKLHELLTGVPNELIWENLRFLTLSGCNVNLRLPVIEGCNADLSDIQKIARKTAGLGIKSVNILPYHDMGKYKYTKLGRDYDGNSMSTPDEEKLNAIKEIFQNHSFTKIKIGG